MRLSTRRRLFFGPFRAFSRDFPEYFTKSRHAVRQFREISLGNDQRVHRRARPDGRIAALIGKQRHLAEIIAGPEMLVLNPRFRLQPGLRQAGRKQQIIWKMARPEDSVSRRDLRILVGSSARACIGTYPMCRDIPLRLNEQSSFVALLVRIKLSQANGAGRSEPCDPG